MGREEIIAHLGEDWPHLQELIREALRSDIPLLQAVNNDIISNAGKMLRPMVGLLISRAIGKGRTSEDALSYAASAELLHNATLLHDDVADSSPTRRGKPTLCSLLGPSTAVLVGDFWLARAMEINIRTKHNNSVVGVFSKAMTNLAEGEMLQLQDARSEGAIRDDYFKIIYCKTASLFETVCLSTAIASDATELEKESAGNYGRALGMAFQIKDDILDYTGDAGLGKPVGSDIREKKMTLPLICALEGSPREEEIRKMFFQVDSQPQFCGQIRKFVLESGGVQKAELILEEYVQKALDALKTFEYSEDVACLEGIARYNSIRRI